MESKEGCKGIDIEPVLCANGCGFYGTIENKNMCSKCYNEYLKSLSTSQENKVDVPVDDINTMMANVSLSLASSSSSSSDHSSENSSSCNRCKSCNKKVGLLGFKCRCGGVFCGKHRYPEEHTCCVDLKTRGRDILEKQNPICKSDKLENRC